MHEELITKEADFMPDWAHALNKKQLEDLHGLCRQCEGNIFVDIGCFIGGFSKIIGQVARERNGFVYSIDLFKLAKEPVVNWGCHQQYDTKELFKRNMMKHGLLEFFEVIEGDADEVSQLFEDDSVDFIFLDAAHNYKSVKSNLEHWYPKLRYGGIICGHDYEFDTYDENYINEDGFGDRHHGVIKAVNEFFGDRGLDFNKGGVPSILHTIWSHKKIRKVI